MYGLASQSNQAGIRTEIDKCSYNPNMKDYLTNMIMQVMNFPRKQGQAKISTKVENREKIIYVRYPMLVPFLKKNIPVYIHIVFVRNVPFEAPQIILETAPGTAPNSKNTDIDVNTKRIMTNTLRNWSQFSNIENAMNEVYDSFSKVFPIYKTTGKAQAPTQNSSYQPPMPSQPSGYQPNQASAYQPNPVYQPNQASLYGNNTNPGTTGGGGIFNVLNNAVQNAYQDNKYGAYKAPTTSIYGRSMTQSDPNVDPNKGNTTAFGGGGIYAQNNNYGQGGIYGNTSPGFIPPSVPPSGGIYGNTNNNLYGNAYNNNYNYNNQYGQYGYNNPPNQYGYNNPPNQYGYNEPGNPNYLGFNPTEELQKALINEVSGKLAPKIMEEKQRLNAQNERLNEYKNQIIEENRRMEDFLNNQMNIRTTCEDDISNINATIKNIQDYNMQNKNITVNSDNCLTFLDVPNPDSMKIIANEVSMEEMILIVKRAYERKKIGFEEAIAFMRNTTRELFAIKFLKEKAIKNA
jgi:hypothetical protein